MNYEIGGWLWLVIDVIFVAALGGGLLYGMAMWRSFRRHPVAAEERDRATRRAYEQK
ncbi:MAG: hypothetical protein ACRD5Z_04290 [Bryobacteraceae bacterium]